MAANRSPSALAGDGGLRLGSGTDQSSAFAQADRHSRRVRFLKIALPAMAIALAGTFAAVSFLGAPDEAPFATTDSAFVDGKLVMASPQLEGLTKDNRPYEMLAQRAIQEVASPGVIQLEAISAKLPLYEKDWVSIDAPAGTYDRDRNTLDMKDPFQIKTSNGLSATINSAFVDMANSSMRTADPVDITVNGSRLTADSMSVLEKGKLFVFDRRVRLVIEPARLNEMRSAGGAGDGGSNANGG